MDNPAKCYDCGLLYSSPAWADVVIPNEWWAKISPSEYPEGGLLCFNCMNKRLEDLDARWVPCKITSGPFAEYENSVERIKKYRQDVRSALKWMAAFENVAKLLGINPHDLDSDTGFAFNQVKQKIEELRS